MTSLAEVLDSVAAGVAAAHDELNRLDAAAGDGDLGNTAVLAAQAVHSAVAASPGADAGVLLRRCGLDMATGAPSTAGTLTARALLAAAKVVDSPLGDTPEGDTPEGGSAQETAADPAQATVRLTQAGFDAALGAIQAAGKAAPGDRTMLDALAPAVAELASAAEAGASLPDALRAAAAAARKGAEATRDMTPRAGRARWLAERSRGTQDAGAHLVALVLELAAAASGL